MGFKALENIFSVDIVLESGWHKTASFVPTLLRTAFSRQIPRSLKAQNGLSLLGCS